MAAVVDDTLKEEQPAVDDGILKHTNDVNLGEINDDNDVDENNDVNVNNDCHLKMKLENEDEERW